MTYKIVDSSNQIQEMNEKFNEIDKKLKNMALTHEERQLLLEERAEYEDQCEELEADENEEEDVQYELVHFKSWFEGCKTIDEVLANIEGLKRLFEDLKSEGHELLQPVDTGYCYIDKVCEE